MTAWGGATVLELFIYQLLAVFAWLVPIIYKQRFDLVIRWVDRTKLIGIIFGTDHKVSLLRDPLPYRLIICSFLGYKPFLPYLLTMGLRSLCHCRTPLQCLYLTLVLYSLDCFLYRTLPFYGRLGVTEIRVECFITETVITGLESGEEGPWLGPELIQISEYLTRKIWYHFAYLLFYIGLWINRSDQITFRIRFT